MHGNVRVKGEKLEKIINTKYIILFHNVINIILAYYKLYLWNLSFIYYIKIVFLEAISNFDNLKLL